MPTPQCPDDEGPLWDDEGHCDGAAVLATLPPRTLTASLVSSEVVPLQGPGCLAISSLSMSQAQSPGSWF